MATNFRPETWTLIKRFPQQPQREISLRLTISVGHPFEIKFRDPSFPATTEQTISNSDYIFIGSRSMTDFLRDHSPRTLVNMILPESAEIKNLETVGQPIKIVFQARHQ